MIADQVFRIVLGHWLAISLVAVVIYLVKTRYHNGLNKYPGPFVASLTNWWRV